MAGNVLIVGDEKVQVQEDVFICEDKRVIADNVHMTNAYQFDKTAVQVCAQRNKEGIKIWEKSGNAVKRHTVEGFYLVPETLYEKLLRKHVEPDKNAADLE